MDIGALLDRLIGVVTLSPRFLDLYSPLTI